MFKFFLGHKNKKGGLTFIELIVVISIFSIMAGIIAFNARDFGDGIALQNLAQNIALKLKMSQNNGSSGIQDSCFNIFGSKPAYGVYFDLNNDSYANNKLFVYYGDFDNSNDLQPFSFQACPSKSNGEIINQYVINNGNTISDICVNEKSGNNIQCGLLELSVVFRRPNLNALFSSGYYNNPISDAEIKITSPKGKTKTIVVWSTGQISVE